MSLRRSVATFASFPPDRSLCQQCAKRLLSRCQRDWNRPFHTRSRVQQIVVAKDGDRVNKSFFWANASRADDTKEFGNEGATISQQLSRVTRHTSSSEAPAVADEASHRRRKRLETASNGKSFAEVPLPPDASSTLSQDAAAAPAKSWRRHVSTYLALTKPRLAFLVVLTSTASYSIYPVPALLSTTATNAPSLSSLTLLFLTTGTFLCIASANTLNMLFEPAHDAKMSRTRNRPLVRGLVSKRAALLFAIATGIVGTGALWYGVNPTTAILGGGNIGLYAFAYTFLKRIHPVNTWVGAIVGAIPPLMGWCAAASQYSTVNLTIWDEAKELLFTEQAIGGWLLAALLFAWQFPHFFALAYGVRHEYANAGYKMLTSSNMAMASRVSLRYSLAMFPICVGLSYYHVTDPAFMVTSSVVNAWMAREAFQMWRLQGERGSARALFWASVWQLPIALVLAMIQKKGLWNRVWRSIMGGEDDNEEEWDDGL
nr:protoheme ix farnesyltransferase, mitochondrial [Quercus suber]